MPIWQHNLPYLLETSRRLDNPAFQEKVDESFFEVMSHHPSGHAITSAILGPFIGIPGLLLHGSYHLVDDASDLYFDLWRRLGVDVASSWGGGGPPDRTLTSTKASKQPPPSRKRFTRAHPSSARGKCPKGYYWSYKKKKCVKSKFR